MTDAARLWLLTAPAISAVASALHFACIVFGAPLYRAVGAGEHMASWVERGRVLPHIYAAAIGTVIAVWALYALSAAGVAPRLPLIRTALVAISVVLLARGLSYPLMRLWRPDLSQSFLIWSSTIVTIYGLCFAVGTWKAWPALSEGLN
jgi:hypothetical protein